ncbi:MAG: hypothetical protein QG671_4128 [Actinomycetota bacterium]|jgi:hypothetical protein|nr:hypothetical protein [Actinomycetota bacterium]
MSASRSETVLEGFVRGLGVTLALLVLVAGYAALLTVTIGDGSVDQAVLVASVMASPLPAVEPEDSIIWAGISGVYAVMVLVLGACRPSLPVRRLGYLAGALLAWGVLTAVSASVSEAFSLRLWAFGALPVAAVSVWPTQRPVAQWAQRPFLLLQAARGALLASMAALVTAVTAGYVVATVGALRAADPTLLVGLPYVWPSLGSNVINAGAGGVVSLSTGTATASSSIAEAWISDTSTVGSGLGILSAHPGVTWMAAGLLVILAAAVLLASAPLWTGAPSGAHASAALRHLARILAIALIAVLLLVPSSLIRIGDVVLQVEVSIVGLVIVLAVFATVMAVAAVLGSRRQARRAQPSTSSSVEEMAG